LAVLVQGLGLDCHECTEVQRNWRGCTEEVPETEFVIDGVPLKRCPLKLLSSITIRFIHFYSYFQKGFLPNPGGVLDQPHKLIEVFNYLGSFILRKEREEQKEKEQQRGIIK
jgi:hypothetical protein